MEFYRGYRGTVRTLFIEIGILSGFGNLAPLRAQVDTGAILGTVKDQSGGVVPNATVTVTEKDTNYSVRKETAGDGSYVFTPLKIGTYSVSVDSPGFEKTTHVGVMVNIQQHTVVDFTLVPGSPTQSVQVTGAPLCCRRRTLPCNRWSVHVPSTIFR